jgi:hypothetical protein
MLKIFILFLKNTLDHHQRQTKIAQTKTTVNNLRKPGDLENSNGPRYGYLRAILQSYLPVPVINTVRLQVGYRYRVLSF